MKVVMLIIFSFLNFAFADSNLQNLIETRSNGILKVWDKDAYVTVDVEVTAVTKALPGVPFLFKLEETDNKKTKLKSLEIKIFTKLEKLPESYEGYIKSLEEKYRIKPTVSLIKHNPLKDNESGQGKNEFSYIKYFASAFIVMAFLILVVIFRGSGKLLTLLEGQLSSLSSVIQSSSGASSSSINSTSNNQSFASGKTSFEINTTANSLWEEMGIDTIIALLTDSYWCEQDNYASYVWKKLNLKQRSQILEKKVLLPDYINYISEIEAIEKKYTDDPYYFNPMQISHLSNVELLKIIEEHPVIYNSISKMRRESLPIKAKDRIKLASVKTAENLDIQFQNIQASESRVISAGEVFSFESFEEELEIISMDGLTVDIMKNYLSLAWLLKIDVNETQDILSSYTAKQLASIWIAPDSILEQLTKLVPNKKMELVNSYLQSNKPSRDNHLYQEIIGQALAILSQGHSKDKKEAA